MSKHIKIREENILGGTRKTYESGNHVHRIEDFLISSSGSKLESVLIFGEGKITEYVRYSPSEGSATMIYKRNLTGENRLVLRSEAAKHVRFLEAEFRYSGQVK